MQLPILVFFLANSKSFGNYFAQKIGRMSFHINEVKYYFVEFEVIGSYAKRIRERSLQTTPIKLKREVEKYGGSARGKSRVLLWRMREK